MKKRIPGYMFMDEAAEFLCISERQLHRLIKNGKAPRSTMYAGRRLFLPVECSEWLRAELLAGRDRKPFE